MFSLISLILLSLNKAMCVECFFKPTLFFQKDFQLVWSRIVSGQIKDVSLKKDFPENTKKRFPSSQHFPFFQMCFKIKSINIFRIYLSDS